MPYTTDIEFFKTGAIDDLEKFVERARSSHVGMPWRCLYAALDPQIAKDPGRRNIATAFLSSSFGDDADSMKAVWLDSGDFFLFFQGPVRAMIKDYENFLDRVSEGQRPEYLFFWKLEECRGYFDQVAARAAEQKPSATKTKEQFGHAEKFALSEDVLRQRRARYKPLLLIVEDDGVTRHMLQATMEKYCDMAVAWDAAQARILYQEIAPNMTFLDIELPDGDGQELAELFCTHDKGSFVVMVSGSLDDDKIKRCIKAGVKGCVAKPTKEQQLLEFVDRYHKDKARS